MNKKEVKKILKSKERLEFLNSIQEISLAKIVLDLDVNLFKELSNTLQHNENLILFLLDKSNQNFHLLPEAYKSGELAEKLSTLYPFIKADINQLISIEEFRFRLNLCPEFLELCSSAYKDNFDYMKIAIEINPSNLEFASQNLRSDKKLVSYAISLDPNSYKLADSSLFCDKELAIYALSKNGHVFDVICDSIKYDFDVLKEALEKEPRLITALPITHRQNIKNAYFVLNKRLEYWSYLDNEIKTDIRLTSLFLVKYVKGHIHNKNLDEEYSKVLNSFKEKISAMSVKEYLRFYQGSINENIFRILLGHKDLSHASSELLSSLSNQQSDYRSLVQSKI